MNTFVKLLPIACILILTQSSVAQRRWGQDEPEGPMPGRLQKFWKMRVIEVLKLNEDDAIRFFAKQSSHDDTDRGLMKTRNDVLNDLESIIKNNGDASKLNAAVDQVVTVDRKLFDERQRYHEELRKFLTAEQFAKLLVFERNFGRQVRNAIEEMHQERRNREMN